MHMIIDGRSIAENITIQLKKKQTDKFLAVFFVGDNAASKSFINQKEKSARSLGIDFRVYHFPAEKVTNESLRKEIENIIADTICGGAIVQLPLPDGFDVQFVLDSIPREKDIDVLSKNAVEAFYNGENKIVPPPVGVVREITKNISLEEKTVAVIGVGRLIGNPIAGWLKGKCRELIVLRRGSDLGVIKNTDIVISGTGIPNLILPDMVKEDAMIIDFGYGKKDGELCGDFDSTSLQETAHIAYTPTPGGTGPILVVKLMENFLSLAA